VFARFLAASGRPGYTVLDPCCGSGSSGEAAIGLGMSYIGNDLNESAVALARRRIADAESQLTLTLTG
jgi:DNA modification methylase